MRPNIEAGTSAGTHLPIEIEDVTLDHPHGPVPTAIAPPLVAQTAQAQPGIDVLSRLPQDLLDLIVSPAYLSTPGDRARISSATARMRSRLPFVSMEAQLSNRATRVQTFSDSATVLTAINDLPVQYRAAPLAQLISHSKATNHEQQTAIHQLAASIHNLVSVDRLDPLLALAACAPHAFARTVIQDQVPDLHPAQQLLVIGRLAEFVELDEPEEFEVLLCTLQAIQAPDHADEAAKCPIFAAQAEALCRFTDAFMRKFSVYPNPTEKTEARVTEFLKALFNAISALPHEHCHTALKALIQRSEIHRDAMWYPWFFSQIGRATVALPNDLRNNIQADLLLSSWNLPMNRDLETLTYSLATIAGGAPAKLQEALQEKINVLRSRESLNILGTHQAILLAVETLAPAGRDALILAGVKRIFNLPKDDMSLLYAPYMSFVPQMAGAAHTATLVWLASAKRHFKPDVSIQAHFDILLEGMRADRHLNVNLLLEIARSMLPILKSDRCHDGVDLFLAATEKLNDGRVHDAFVETLADYLPSLTDKAKTGSFVRALSTIALLSPEADRERNFGLIKTAIDRMYSSDLKSLARTVVKEVQHPAQSS